MGLVASASQVREGSVRSVHVGLLAIGVFSVVGFQAIAQQRPPGAIPVGGLTPAQQIAFNEGSHTFSKNYEIADGLGPVFNDESCSDCHRNGGGTNRTVRRFGRVDRGVFDPLAELGGSLIQSRGIGSITTVDGTHDFVGERTPPDATVTTLRRSQAVQGLGLVDAVPDDTWRALAQAQLQADPSTAGRVNIVLDLSTGRAAVGKVGWKAQVPTLMQFAGDALLDEIGITNPLFRDEVCPQGDCRALDFNPAPAMNDDGRDVEDLTNFMTMLAPPARGPITDDVFAGEQVFMQIGCDICHRPTLRSGPSPVDALHRVDFHPYSDFLLHDMGSLGDGIAQGQATGLEIRTQPLWGLRNTNRFMHDAATNSIEEAIRRHDGQARAAREQFVELAPGQLAQVLAFLRSL
jgi:CxxC motif-containing protein (DUF1111 family)